jgi:hypothetical protein
VYLHHPNRTKIADDVLARWYQQDVRVGITRNLPGIADDVLCTVVLTEREYSHHPNLTGIADNVLAVAITVGAYLRHPNFTGVADNVLAGLCSQIVRICITQVSLASLTMPFRRRAHR